MTKKDFWTIGFALFFLLILIFWCSRIKENAALVTAMKEGERAWTCVEVGRDLERFLQTTNTKNATLIGAPTIDLRHNAVNVEYSLKNGGSIDVGRTFPSSKGEYDKWCKLRVATEKFRI